jgi:hypothetical protein
MKKVPIEILTSWAEKLNISIEQVKEILKKYESQFDIYDDKFEDIYSYLHEKVMMEEFGLNSNFEIDSLSRDERKLILNVIASISRKFYDDNLSENQKKYFYQTIKSFKIGEFSTDYNFELLSNLHSKEVNTYLYRAIREFNFLGEDDKFDDISKNVLSYIALSSKIKEDIDLDIENLTKCFGIEVLIYKKGISYLEESKLDERPLNYSLDVFKQLENNKSLFSNIKVVNSNLKDTEILDNIIEYKLNINADSVLAIVSNNQQNEMFNGIIFMDDSLFIMEKDDEINSSIFGQLEEIEESLLKAKNKEEELDAMLKAVNSSMFGRIDKLMDVIFSEIDILKESREKIEIIVNDFRSVLDNIDYNLKGIRIYYKDIEVFDIEDLEENGIEKILYRDKGKLKGVSTKFLTDEIKDIIFYFSKVNGNYNLESKSLLHLEERKNEFFKAYDFKVFGRELSQFEREVHKYYEHNLSKESEWFNIFSIKDVQVSNIKDLIDSTINKEDILLFCDLAPFKKNGKEGIVISKDNISIRSYIGKIKNRVSFKDIQEFSSKEKSLEVELTTGDRIELMSEDYLTRECHSILEDIFSMWKKCNGA